MQDHFTDILDMQKNIGYAGSLRFGLSQTGDILAIRLEDSVLLASQVRSMLIRKGVNGQPHYLLYITKDNFLHTKSLEEVRTAIEHRRPSTAR